MVADRDKHQPQSKSAITLCGTGLARHLHRGNVAALYMCLHWNHRRIEGPVQSGRISSRIILSKLVVACKRLMVADRDKHQPQSKSAITPCGTGLARHLHRGNVASFICLAKLL